MNNYEFFDSLSSDYDDMINFSNSLKNKISLYDNLCKSEYKTALDIGCGTGADSIALAKLGLKVDALDHSQGMLKIARRNSEFYGVTINFIHSDLLNINFQSKFDLIVSLGNTLANINKPQLNSLFSQLSKTSTKEGKIAFQLINFKSLPGSGEYFLNEFEDDNIVLTRKYLLYQSEVDFIVEKRNKNADNVTRLQTRLYRHSAEDFRSLAEKHGMTAQVYGSISMDPYSAAESKNLVILLNKEN